MFNTKGLLASSFISFLVLANLQAAKADTILIDVFAGNDGINSDGSTQLESLASLASDVDQLGRVNWVFDADPDQVGNQLINPQSSEGLTVTGTVFNSAPDSTEATAGTWSYSGIYSPDYITIKFDSYVALYEITDGDTSGAWDLSSLCYINTDWCLAYGGKKDTKYKPYALSHMAAYTEVTPVPLPAAVWLFGSGVLGLIGFARRNKSS